MKARLHERKQEYWANLWLKGQKEIKVVGLSPTWRKSLCGQWTRCFARSSWEIPDVSYRRRWRLIRLKDIVFLSMVSWDKTGRCQSQISFVASSVEFSIVMRRTGLRERLRRRWSSWLIQGVRTLVLLAHPIHDEHYHQDCAKQANYRSTNHRCKRWNLISIEY